jgi:hypothetical protein
MFMRIKLYFQMLMTASILLACSPKSSSMNITQTPHPDLRQNSMTLSPTETATMALPTPTPVDHLTQLIVELEKNMLRKNTETFVPPNNAQQQDFQTITRDLLVNETKDAAHIAPLYNYELLTLSDPFDAGTESYILHERPPIEYGWGLYIIRSGVSQNTVIESPHPLFDLNTPEVALHLYRALQAKALLIAGSHRYTNADGSADAAHAPESIFQAMHIALFEGNNQPDTERIFLQIHGHNHQDDQTYPQVIIGYNRMEDPEKEALLTRISNALTEHGISVAICNGENFRDLCGTLNIQRKATSGGIFIHLELERSLRENDSAFVEALKQALNP